MRETHRCISLCDPGVHAFLLVAPLGPLTDEDRGEILKIQQIFGTQVTDHMIGLFTCEFNPSSQPVVIFLQQDNDTQQLLNAFGNRYCIFNKQETLNNPLFPQLLMMIEKMNKRTESCFSLDMYWEAQMERRVRELEAKHKTELENKDRKIKELEENMKMMSQSNRLNVVLCGRTGAGKTSAGNTILGLTEPSADPSSSSVCVKRQGVVCGRLVTVVELPALYNTQLSEKEVMRETHRCISLCDPGVHAFLLVAPLGPLTDDDRGEILKIQQIF
ncbi:hypothetical protein JZ751_026024, partial [Albula glossodonta]